MKYCFGTVSWNGYLERFIDIFADNYITLFRRLINLGIDYRDIVEPRIIYNNDQPGDNVDKAVDKILNATGKTTYLIEDTAEYGEYDIMYSTRNDLRKEFRKALPNDKKVFWYFPIDDHVRPDAVDELMNLAKRAEKGLKTACMFKFFVKQNNGDFSAGTRAIRSYDDIHTNDWGGYCAYNIIDEDDCPLYPEIAIPNVAFYADLYEAGYYEYESKVMCVDHLRHSDSHHFKYKDTKMSETVKDYLLAKRVELKEKGL